MQEETLDKIAFQVSPFKISKGKFSVKLDQLNAELEKYKLRVDTLDDIYIDKELTEINTSPVIKIHLISLDNSDSQIWDAATQDWFFNQALVVEDMFEADSEVFSSCEIDRAEYIMTCVLNTDNKNIGLDKKFAAGGQAKTNNDYELEQAIAANIDINPLVAFAEFGIEAHTSPEDYEKKKAQVLAKSMARYKTSQGTPMVVFYQGKKINIANGADRDNALLQADIAQLVIDDIQAGLLETSPEAAQYMQAEANNRAIMIIDYFKGKLAKEAAESGKYPAITTDQIHEAIEIFKNTTPKTANV